MGEDEVFRLSPLEEERFGVRTARAEGITAADVPGVLELCREQRVRLLIARCRVEDLAAVHALERAGALLMDTLTYLERDLEDPPLPEEDSAWVIRMARPEEAPEVRKLAGEAFRGHVGHYHADPRLDPAQCDEVYADWAWRLCLDSGPESGVLVAEGEEELAGFGSIRFNSPEEGEGVLSGVVPACRRRGLQRALMIARLHWCRERGARRMLISPCVANRANHRVAARLGFMLSHAYYTFHKWFD